MPADLKNLKWVSGPNKKGERFQVTVGDFGGAKSSRNFASIEKAREWADKCRLSIAEVAGGTNIRMKVPKYDGTTNWWNGILAHVASEMLKAPDQVIRETYRKDLLALGSASKAVKSLLDSGTMEKRLESLEAILTEIKTKKQTAAGSRGSVVPIKKERHG